MNAGKYRINTRDGQTSFIELILIFWKFFGNFKDILIEEKKQLLQFISNLIEKLNEKTSVEYKNESILNIVLKTLSLTALKQEETVKIFENLFFNYTSKKNVLRKIIVIIYLIIVIPK